VKLVEPLALSFTEHMEGTYTPRVPELPGGAFAFTFEVDCEEVDDAGRVVRGAALGTVSVAGLAQDAPAGGARELSPHWRRTIRYAFGFDGQDGRRYRFEGTKTIRWLRALTTWTTLPGRVVREEDGRCVADVVARFDLRAQLGALVRSVRRVAPRARPDDEGYPGPLLLHETGATGGDLALSPRLLTDAQRRQAVALAALVLPPTGPLEGGGPRTVEAAERLLREWGGGAVERVGQLVALLDAAALASTGKRLEALSPAEKEALGRRWEGSALLRWPYFAAALLLKTAHFDHPGVYAAFGATYKKGGPAEPARWLEQVVSGATIKDGEALEAHAVVIGTGAGGAVVGKELAEQGYAVVFLEEGELWRRDAFVGSSLDSHGKFYRGKGRVVAVGNTIMPVLMGRMVGGSTALNTGTCFRTPDWILSGWCEALGTDALSPAAMAPHFAAVERELGIAPARAEVAGGGARVVARGCEALGWHHFPVRRNAPDCDGQGVCDFGCPTDARRSTNVSYIPSALSRGAMLYTGTRAERLLVEGGRCVGVEARGTNGARLRVRAQVVVLAGGAIPSPSFLLQQGLCDRSGQLGRNLSLHPATAMLAMFDESLRVWNGIPQGWCCDEFHRDGILLLGANPPISLAGSMMTLSGQRLMDAMLDLDKVAGLGVMVEDEHTRGRVRVVGGRPLVTYRMGAQEVERLHQGLVRAGELFHAAGARRLFPLTPRVPSIDDRAAFERFRGLSLRPWDFMLTSFHPIGTCRMGSDPRTSVVGFEHEAHDLPGLFIVDGSTVPGPPAVNPQLTIMGMAHRAAGILAGKLG
jgi:choline dehydrogenase-like flavoprotein